MLGRAMVLCLLCTVAAPARSHAVETGNLSWSGRIGVATGLVYRGIKLNEEDLVPDLDVAVEHASGFYLHGWLTRVDLPQPDYYYASSDTMWQTLLDAGYIWRASPAWTVTVGHGWYRYSGQLSERSPDYREWLVGVDYKNLLVLDYAHAEKLWGIEEQQDALSLSVYWPFSRRLIGAATLGWVEQDGLYQDRYNYLRFNLGYLLPGSWSVQLQYHDAFGIGEIYREHGAKREWVAQLNWHW